jgi:acetyl-CoA C-acetyltransferase
VDDVAFLDLYSCFPIAVELAGDALGIDPVADERAPSVTGGMTFFGGPGNNYVTHSIATMAERLRGSPGATGLVTGLGWYASTHSWGTYSSSPPRDGFRAHRVQAEVDAVPLRDADDDYTGPAQVESYTVVHDRDGLAARAIVSLITPTGARRLFATEDRDVAAGFMDRDPLGERAVVGAGSISLP